MQWIPYILMFSLILLLLDIYNSLFLLLSLNNANANANADSSQGTGGEGDGTAVPAYYRQDSQQIQKCKLPS